MRKTYPLRPEGKNPDRVLDAVKHDIRKYMKRERRRDLPEGATFWDFDCRFGADKDSAQTANPAELIGLLDVLAKAGGAQCYVELLAKPGVRQPRPVGQEVIDDAGASPAPSDSDD
ncbi:MULTISPECIES: DUF6172 family protein [Hydrogenophaga]|uniref:DUF6172 family protein n=1 Tax=Hydrogenophaga TaxID=47420 RepID=UPI001CFA74D1|nr:MULTISPECIES: DUF6172 family protein [Hydrogenophaga]MDO9032006.1 DUF6172 family protein [Hydrogenophaga sp.]UCU96344.1 hypothetical protein KI616_11160 [Hydrogenophaga taeniospiralis]